jgi:conjugal transfer pilus assembly protein TraF
VKARLVAVGLIGVVTTLGIGACAQAASQAAHHGTPSNASDERRGYWWKKEPPVARDAREMDAPPAADALVAMHPKDLEQMLEAYKDYAIWKQTPQSVQWYYQVQDAVRLKSRAFMNVTEMVMLTNPALNMQTEYPTNPVGQAARYKAREDEIEARLRAERDGAALIMLSQEGCEYCEAQRGILKYFQSKYGWDVREMDVREHPEAMARFGTQYTPTTIVIFRGRADWQPVALGVETLERVEESTYRAIRYVNGEVTPDQYTLEERHDGGLYDPRRGSR